MMSANVRGLNQRNKQQLLEGLVSEHLPSVLLLQEIKLVTKMQINSYTST